MYSHLQNPQGHLMQMQYPNKCLKYPKLSLISLFISLNFKVGFFINKSPNLDSDIEN